MSINDFIVDQIEARAAAAQDLAEDLTINGISIYAGCSYKGIHVRAGIDELAELLGVKAACKLGEISPKTNIQLNEYWFMYAGVRFYELRAETPSDGNVDFDTAMQEGTRCQIHSF